MDFFKYKEDTSLEARKLEISVKKQRINKMLDERGMEALLLTKHPNFSWITAGGKNFVANCFDGGAVSILVTRQSMYAVCNIIEEPRLRTEELLPELGFELFVYGWEENRLEEFVSRHVSSMDKVVSDLPCGSAVVENGWISPLRYCMTENEMGRYRYLGDTMSMALEEYLPTVKPGMTELEIAGGISKALWKYNIEQVMHLVSADERACLFRHGLPTDKPLKNNLIVSINGRYKGLVTTVSRMIHFGRPDTSLTEQYRDCSEMECMAAAKAAVGADELDMYETLKQAYLDRGYPGMFEKHGQGGCQGYWPREYMITPDCHHKIQENQAYCYNPVVDGTKSEDSFMVTKDGPLFITRPITYPKLVWEVNGIRLERPDMLVVD